jgi:hypothetical protein
MVWTRKTAHTRRKWRAPKQILFDMHIFWYNIPFFNVF